MTFDTCETSITGLESLSVEKNLIYPNPTNGLIYFNSVEDVSCIFIYNAFGEQLDCISPIIESNLNLRYSSGIYILKFIYRDESICVRKVVIL
jgi:hypothetical protein